jgi:hypothetical protein
VLAEAGFSEEEIEALLDAGAVGGHTTDVKGTFLA